MGKLSYLTIIFALVVLCALPLYCELKIEESLNLDVMNEAYDIPEAMRTKRRLQNINYQYSIKSKQTPKEEETSNQKEEDFNTLKLKSSIVRYQARYGKQRTLNAISAKQENEGQKSSYQQLSEYTANKKSIGPRDLRYSLKKCVPQEVKDDKYRSCIADKEAIDEIQGSHILDKRSEVLPLKSGNKNKSRSEIKLITSNELKSRSRKREILFANKTVNYLQKNVSKKTSTGTLSKGLEKDGDDDNEACVDKSGPVKKIKRSQNENTKPKGEGIVPASFKIFPRMKEFRKDLRSKNSKQVQEPQDGYNEENKDEYNVDEDDYDEHVHENNEEDDSYIKHRNPVILDEVVPKFFIPQPDVIKYVNNRTKFSQVLS